MTTFNLTWQKLKKSKKYREEYALAMLKRIVPFQIGAIRRKREWSQALLAEKSTLTQGVVSRAEDPDYGNLTLNTIGRIAAGFDLAFVGRFVPFSELVKLSEDLSESEFSELPTFEKEDERVSAYGMDALTPGNNLGDRDKNKTERKSVLAGQQLAAMGKRPPSPSGDKQDNIPEELKELAAAASMAGGGSNNERRLDSSR